MAISRNAILDALTARLATIPDLKECSRVLKMPDDAAQPAIYVACIEQATTKNPGCPFVWQLGAELYVYNKDANAAGAGPGLHALMDAIEAKLERQRDEDSIELTTTLGGLVYTTNIQSLVVDEGHFTPQGVAVLKVQITATA